MINYNVEFFVGKDGRDVVYQTSDRIYHTFTDDDADLIQQMIDRISDEYPEAYTALFTLYNKAYNYKYLIIRRFVKCNFSILDDHSDIQGDGSFRFEFVNCPLRGECPHDMIICQPKFNTRLSRREEEIVKLINLPDAEIGDKLFISPFTVHNHIKSILRKLNLHSKTEISDWAHKNNL
jgi:DNA-binding CsgD family transcriptional regulator